MMRIRTPLPMEEIHAFCRRWKVKELAVFGSILRDDFGPDSDVDFLVTWQPDAGWSWAERMTAQEELSGVVGRPVDLVSRRAIEESPNWIRRQRILASAEVVHAA